ncbi:helix-turn-helix domain-containing protein [Ruicaihuangia caeni]|uniref:Helix-turn-helix transcriptional regulator n=1 Tax=Ruicaihuangia caeni TaxID=3042517 RepID=A0AAW6T8U2_9MICO|nr:helix-turn-helix transcriptional regulator [Klugiella sp. YN-L-19]MDI2097562.1 helix-turn-helix transcriptional regulator [Klugiella sp. YN-L-19]
MPASKSVAAITLGQRVREARLRLGLSQEDIAELAGLHWTNWGKVERGVANPNLLASC